MWIIFFANQILLQTDNMALLIDNLKQSFKVTPYDGAPHEYYVFQKKFLVFASTGTATGTISINGTQIGTTSSTTECDGVVMNTSAKVATWISENRNNI